MEQTLYMLIEDAIVDLSYVMPENMIERMCSSLGCHIINLVNLREKRVFQGISPANYRQHLVIVAPSGYGKSAFLNIFLHPKYGLLKRSNIHTDVVSTFSQESWAGTITKTDDKRVVVDGVFADNKQGILGADDYMKLKLLMDGTGMEHDEVYLMTALESEYMNKRLSTGKIEVNDIGMTFWAGIRPTALSMQSGLARRFMYQIFYPSQKDAEQYKIKSRMMVKQLKEESRVNIANKIQEIYDANLQFTAPDFTNIDAWVDSKMRVPHFEDKIYRRIALGYSIVNGTFPEIKVDDRLASMLQDEYKNRKRIKGNPLPQIIMRCLSDVDFEREETLITFISDHYQYNKAEIDNAIKTLLWDKEVIKEDGIIVTKQKYVPAKLEIVFEKGDQECPENARI